MFLLFAWSMIKNLTFVEGSSVLLETSIKWLTMYNLFIKIFLLSNFYGDDLNKVHLILRLALTYHSSLIGCATSKRFVLRSRSFGQVTFASSKLKCF